MGQPIEQIKRCATDKLTKKERLRRESFWIKELRTLTPYGLNDRLDSHDWRFRTRDDIAGKMFQSFATKRGKRGSKKNRNNSCSCDSLMDETRKRHDNLRNWRHFLRCSINAIRIKFLPKLAWKYMGLFHDPTSDYPMEVINLALDMINFRLYDFRKKKKEKKRSNFVKVYFQAKVIECLRLSYILRKHSDCIPDDFVDRDIPTILYKRSKNIGSTIFNYKDTVEEVKTNEWKANYNLLPGCDCKDSKFCDPHHGHIVTGDLRFIKNKKLRSLLCKGPGYRERQSVNWKRFMTDFKISLDTCVNKWASSEEQDVSCLNEWKAKVLHDVQTAIKRLNKKRRYNQKRKTMILKSPKVMSELAELQKKYVFTNR